MIIKSSLNLIKNLKFNILKSNQIASSSSVNFCDQISFSNFWNSSFLINRSYGTNPGQKAQSAAKAQEAAKIRSKQLSRLRGAIRIPQTGELEFDLTKNQTLKKMVAELLKEGLPKDIIERTLDPSKKLTEMMVMADGPVGICLLINCEAKNLQVARSNISQQAKRSKIRLTVTEAFNWDHYFERKGFIDIPNKLEGKLMDDEVATDLAIEVNAEEFSIEGDLLKLVCNPSDYKSCLSALEERNIKVLEARLSYRPLEKIELDENYTVFMRAFAQKISGNIDVNFNCLELIPNYDL